MNTIAAAIAQLDRKLQGVPFGFAFLGGSVLSLLVTDPEVDAIRVTKDVDVMVDVRNRNEFHKAERILEALGFRHDTREGAPICRWRLDELTVDVLPIREDVLGWNSKWFEEALSAATEIDCAGRKVRVVSAPYFVALKLEAFEDRGQGDFLTSTDFEDIICLFNGRASIVDEIAAEPQLAMPLSLRFKEYIKRQELEDAIDGFVQTEADPEASKQAIVARFRQVAALAE